MLGEVLEDRAVPSRFGFGFGHGVGPRFGSGFGFGGFFGGPNASVPAQDAQQVARAFGTFQQTYNQDVATILLPAGTTSAANNRTAFNAAVTTALGTLNTSIDGVIKNLPMASSLATTIQGELLGSGPNTLQTLLAGVPTPTTTGFFARRIFLGQSAVDINQTAALVTNQVRTSSSPAGSISQQTLQQDLGQVQTAFQSFRQTYFGDVQTILLPAGTTNPSANRPAFDQAVGTALGTLNSSIDTALSNLPAAVTATLNTTIKNDLLSGGSSSGNSLQSQLAALATPSSTFGFSTFTFRLMSGQTIGNAQGQVSRDIVAAVNQYNATLAG
jgi:hypothetical protein